MDYFHRTTIRALVPVYLTGDPARYDRFTAMQMSNDTEEMTETAWVNTCDPHYRTLYYKVREFYDLNWRDVSLTMQVLRSSPFKP